MFADDTSLFYSHKNEQDAVPILNAELSKISNWLAANKLSLNVGKSKLLIFTNQKSKSTSTKHNDTGPSSTNPNIAHSLNKSDLFINGEKLKEVDHAKYLGVLIDNKLKWTNQIDAINLKLSKGIGLLAKILTILTY